MSIEAILQHVGAGFLSLERGFVFGPQGKLIRRNLEQLWFRNCVITPSYNVFLSPSTDSMAETLENLKKSGISERPMGIGVIEDLKNTWNTEISTIYPKIKSHTVARVSTFVDSSESKDLYHKKQRERKVWWRKFAREPSKFTFSEVKKVTKLKDTLEIAAQFPWGPITVETITFNQDVRKFATKTEEEVNSDTHMVEHTASLDWGCLAFLCDAYTQDSSSQTAKLDLNLQLSPYKVGFCLPPVAEQQSDPKSAEKSRLLIYLNNLLKVQGVETIVGQNSRPLESFQVPFIVTVDDASLQNGLIKIWNKQTTLSETVHMSELTKYILLHCGRSEKTINS